MLQESEMGIAVTARWVALFALGLLLASQGGGVSTLIGLLAFGAMYNFLFSINWLRGATSRNQQIAGVTLDFLLAAGVFYVSRTLLGGLVWAGLLPIASAALVFWLAGGVGAAVAMTIGFAALATIDIPISEIPPMMLWPAAIFLGAGLIIGFGSPHLLRRLKYATDSRQTQVDSSQRRAGEQNKALFEITSALNASLVFDQVLENALDLALNSLSATHETVSPAAGGILLIQEGGLRLAAGRQLEPSVLGRVLPAEQGALATLMQNAESFEVADPIQDPEFGLIAGLENCRSLYCTPLRSGIDLFGAMFLAHPLDLFFTAQRREHIDLIARQVMVALQNAQLYESLSEEKERILHIQDQARNQLARNFHDGPSQSVAAIAMRTSLVRRLVSKDPAAARDELFKLEDLARRTTKEMRHMLFTLRPQVLETSGLIAALNDLANQIEDSEERIIRIESAPESTDRMDLGKLTVLFHIAAEAVNNAFKHAQATHITVRLNRPQPDVFLLEVEDDGQGFTSQQEQMRRNTDGALGLSTLRERVKLINGIVQLDSTLGRGTHLRVWAPLTEAAGERLRRGT